MRRALLAALVTAFAIGGPWSMMACASKAHEPHASMRTVWRDYVAMPPERALAIAGTPGGDRRWVTASSGGHASIEDAKERALEACRVRRKVRRLQAGCVLYAVGDEVVWRGR